MRKGQLKQWAVHLGTGLAGLLTVGVALTIALYAFVVMANRELEDREIVTKVLEEGRGESPIIVNLLVHSFSPEQNTLEVSYVIQAPNLGMNEHPGGSDCMKLHVMERSPETMLAPKVFGFACVGEPGYAYAYGETPHITIPAYQSVEMFPFDDIIAFPDATLKTGGDYDNDVTYKVTKLFPGRVLAITGSPSNWNLRFERSLNEKISILTGAILFIMIAVLFGAGLVRRSSAGRVSQEDFIAIAGYVISATGFREFLRVSKLPSTSLFELIVFVLPLAVLCLVIFVSHLWPRPINGKA